MTLKAAGLDIAQVAAVGVQVVLAGTPLMKPPVMAAQDAQLRSGAQPSTLPVEALDGVGTAVVRVVLGVAVPHLSMEHQTRVVAAVAPTLVMPAVLVLSSSDTVLRNFSTGETHETHHSRHRCGTDPDGLRYKPRRLLQGHRCA
jgi:hypothetical protein